MLDVETVKMWYVHQTQNKCICYEFAQHANMKAIKASLQNSVSRTTAQDNVGHETKQWQNVTQTNDGRMEGAAHEGCNDVGWGRDTILTLNLQFKGCNTKDQKFDTLTKC